MWAGCAGWGWGQLTPPPSPSAPRPRPRSAAPQRVEAPTRPNGGTAGVCGHRRGQFGRVLFAQRAPRCPQGVPAGKGGTCHARKRPNSACVPRFALVKARGPSWPSSEAGGAGVRSAARRRGVAAARGPSPSPTSLRFGPMRLGARAPRHLPAGPAGRPCLPRFPASAQHLPGSAHRLPGGRAARKGGCEGVLVGYDEGEAHRGRVDGRERAHAGAAPRESLHLLAHPHLDLCAEARSTSSRLRSAPRRLLVPKVPALTPANATSHRTPPSPPRD